jgi:hypothetical protein
MKLAVVHAPADKQFSAKLTLWFTGSTAYHCGFVDEETGTFYDMHLLPRKTHWPRHNPPRWVNLYEVPNLTREHCESFLKQDSHIKYGVWDYILFGLRPVYHLLGLSTRNAGGWICSELCAEWLRRVGYYAPEEPVPSPADLEDWVKRHTASAQDA